MQRLLYKNQYFERLFPSLKEQKPGKDLYAVLATFQFLICLFMILFYTKMDADITNMSDSLTYNQFSGHMVVALFLQILVMIIDRYMYKSKTFISVQQELEKKQTNKDSLIDKHLERSNTKDRGKSFIQFLNSASMKNILRQKRMHSESSSSRDSEEEQERQELERQISLESTKITLAIVSKYYL